MRTPSGSLSEQVQNPQLAARGLSFERDGLPVFDPVDLAVCEGEAIEVVGPNGSGKTTLLRCLAGLNQDFVGAVTRTGTVAWVGHRVGLNPNLTGLEQLRWYAALCGVRVAPEQLHRALERAGVPGAATSPCGRLSEGQRRRAALARLLVGTADVWVLDEPFTALDEDGRGMARRLIEEHIGAGGALVCATHQPLEMASARILKLAAPMDEPG